LDARTKVPTHTILNNIWNITFILLSHKANFFLKKLDAFTSIFFIAVLILSIMIAPVRVNAIITNLNPSGDATLLDSESPTNYGQWNLLCGNWTEFNIPQTYRALIQFDLSSIPSGATVNEAHLHLYLWLHYGSHSTQRTYSTNRVTKAWIEGDGPFTTPFGGTYGTTWNDADKSVPDPWTSPGGDFTTVGAATVVTRTGTTMQDVTGWYDLDVTAIVKTWIEDGQPNYGFLIKDLNEGSGTEYYVVFTSREGSNKPILEIDYDLPSQQRPLIDPSSSVIGGYCFSINKLEVLSPYLMAIGLMGSVIIASCIIRGKRH
jgi:hypothetical protein